MRDMSEHTAAAARNGLHAYTKVDAGVEPKVEPGAQPGAAPGVRPCGSCGEAARQRRIAQRAKRQADQAAKDLTQS